MLGGALYGLGTFINGGCVFGTVARIASGNPSFLAALPGFALGAGLGTAAALPRLKLIAMESPLREPGLGGFVILIVAAAFVGLAVAGITRTHRRAGLCIGQILRASRWRTSFAMMVLGILGGLLFATGAAWSYPALLNLNSAVSGFEAPVFAGASTIGCVMWGP
jgi:toxin CptA